ncbi:MAG TPA: 1-deoxy-D-xylulose-5-phosphate reductoisomerase, partial [Pirellulaceae bacterium]|nr:1-deoxy-D-xylulose-5-phosphate reductoisomerase [Pirellulaceae bacterium]
MGSKKNLAILGATGSIGRNAIAVLDHLPEFAVWCLSGSSNLDLLCQQAERCQPQYLIAADAVVAREYEFPIRWRDRVRVGESELSWAAAHDEVDVVLAAIVGCAGLSSTAAAIEAGKTVALANKEALVVAGQILMPRTQATGARLVPVDSEHSAIWQAALAGRRDEIERVVLTASGGPFRDWSRDEMRHATPQQALAHPTWDMGPKITIDSATMMNKALEIIEARWLFDLRPDQITVVIHPQSIIHSMVEFRDGSVLAQLSPPDMKLPIQYALSYPDRRSSSALRLNWTQTTTLDWFSAHSVRFPALG